MIKIAPSVLSLDFSTFKESIETLNKSADWVHFDVMDGHFVPNLSYGPKILSEIKKVTTLFCDVHIMVSNPLETAEWFIDEGADLVTFHIEAVENHYEALEVIHYIKSKDVQVGLSIKPNTSVAEIEPLLKHLDLVLVMSVEPGFGGQSFIYDSIDKVKQLNDLRDEHDYKYLIEIDGGINDETGKLATDAGCDVLVAGSYVFNGDIEAQIKTLR